MRVLHSPLHGTVRAAEKKDLPALRSLAAVLMSLWIADIIARFDLGECGGDYAPFAEISVYYVPPRGTAAHVTSMPLLLPGISYGTALWEPMTDTLIAQLRARGFDCSYNRGASGTPQFEELCRHASVEIAELRAKRSGQ